MKTKEKKEKAIEEEKKETKPEENGVKLTDEQLEKVNGGGFKVFTLDIG